MQTVKLHKKPKGIFLFVDDDKDEHFLLKMSMKQLEIKNQVVSCYNGLEALTFLRESDHEIFLILSDINMPKMDGLEFKRMIDLIPELKAKAIPFFYHTSKSTPAEVKTAYSLNIQGYLKKAPDIDGTIRSIARIIELWTDCVHPKDFYQPPGSTDHNKLFLLPLITKHLISAASYKQLLINP